MRTLRSFFHRLRSLFSKERLDRDLNDELRAHFAMHTADNLRAGMLAEEARRAALLKLGGLEQTKESIRDRRGFPFLETLLQDLRFAFRMLAKDPGFTAVFVFWVGPGVGATTADLCGVEAALMPSPGRRHTANQ